jgi:hypothetical protein
LIEKLAHSFAVYFFHRPAPGVPCRIVRRDVANATARYAISLSSGRGEIFVFTDWAYRSRIRFFLYESVEFQDRSLLEGGVRIGYARDRGRYEIAAFGRNITNDTSIEGRSTSTASPVL